MLGFAWNVQTIIVRWFWTGLYSTLLLPVAAFALPLPASVTLPASVQWSACPAAAGFDCATVAAPLDYAHADGRVISLAVIRHVATDPANRIGTLFFNPGGPGGQGTQDLPNWFALFPAAVRSRFDIVSWDPRGIGNSTAVQCFDTEADENSFFAGVPVSSFPVGIKQKLAWIDRFAAFGKICQQRNGNLLRYTSTTDTARDMDLLRQAVGAPTLNYLGVSYGTFVGAVYANLFPDRIRAMILDGNLVPSVYTNNGNDRVALSDALRFGTAASTAESLDAFLDRCGLAGSGKCAFSTGDAGGTRAKFDTLLQRLKQRPVTFNGVEFTYAETLAVMRGWLFTVAQGPGFAGWVLAATVLQDLWTASDPGAAVAVAAAAMSGATSQAATVTPANGKYASNWQSLTVECGDSPNPRPAEKFLALDRFAYATLGPIGVVDLWLDEPCASWPVKAANQYVGPWNKPTPNTILVVGNTHDPSTPYANSVALVRELGKARLLTVEGFGHTELLNPSQCAGQFESSYLIDGTLPPEGTVCQQDVVPFQ